MNKPRGGRELTIQGIKCHLPPVPPKHEIQNWDKPKNEQKWQRTELPIFRAADVDIFDGSENEPTDVITFDEAWRQQSIKIFGTDPYDIDRQGFERKVPGVESDPDYSMDCLAPFVEQELNRVKNGHWIYINGDPIYLTGQAYFYFNYWTLKSGYPEFRYVDLELFYFWESVKRSKNFFGIFYVTIRGVGKSYISGCINYYEAISKKNARTTVQSLNDDASGDWFRDKVLLPITKLPKFLVPINKHGISDITAQSTYEMVPPARKGMSVRIYNKMKDEALYSKMQTSIAAETGADGGTWDLLVQEEMGKCSPATADVFKRIMINKFTVFRANTKYGNIFASSTVGEMDEGGLEAFKVWENSNQYVSNSTVTGLARYFRSDLDATCFDEFGYSVPIATDKAMQDYLEEKYGEPFRMGAMAFHDEHRRQLANDQKGLIQYKQLNPRNEEEAFWIGAEKCIYNADILLNAKDVILHGGRNFIVKGDIVWKEKDKEAMFVENKVNGKWHISFQNFEPNQVKINEGRLDTFTPLCAHKRVIGIDPYSVRDLAEEGSGSMGAAAVYNRYDMHIPEEFCDTIIADYLFRPPDPFDFYEDMLAAAFWFGCPIFIETNKSNAMDYFRIRGYAWGYEANPLDFIWERPRSTFTSVKQKDTDGMYNSQGTIEHYTNSTSLHIAKHGYKLKHLRVINDWLLFNPKKTKQFDLGVAASMAVVAAERKGVETSSVIDLSNLFRTYNNSGAASVVN